MKDILSKPHVLSIMTSVIERELIFGTSGVQITKVDADSYLSVLLGDGNNVGKPVRMLLLSNETRVYELSNF